MTRSLRRRHVLAGGAAILSTALAGCWGHGPHLKMRTVSDSMLLSDAVDSIPDEPTIDTDIYIVETIENGTNRVSYPSRYPPMRAAQPIAASNVEPPIEYGGAYYTLALTRRVPRPLLVAGFRIGAAETPAEDDPNSIAYGDLPEIDRRKLAAALPPDSDGVRIAVYYDNRNVDRSELVPEPDHEAIVRDGNRYSIEPESAEEKQGYNYHYEAERVASADEEFLSWLRSEYRVGLTGLSGDEREIVSEAIGESRYSGSEDDEVFNSLAERFLSHPAIDRGEEDSGTWFVRYDGTEYLAELRSPTQYE